MQNFSKNLSGGFLSKKFNDKLAMKHSAFSPLKAVTIKHRTENIYAIALIGFRTKFAFLPFL
jgi:hypothetical protein